MTLLLTGAALIGSQIARILVERGQRPVLMDIAPQPAALKDIVDLARVTLLQGSVMQLESLRSVIQEHGITDIVHTAAYPMLTQGAQRNPYAAIELNIMGTVNVLEVATTAKLRRVVVASSNVLSHFLTGGE